MDVPKWVNDGRDDNPIFFVFCIFVVLSVLAVMYEWHCEKSRLVSKKAKKFDVGRKLSWSLAYLFAFYVSFVYVLRYGISPLDRYMDDVSGSQFGKFFGSSLGWLWVVVLFQRWVVNTFPASASAPAEKAPADKVEPPKGPATNTFNPAGEVEAPDGGGGAT